MTPYSALALQMDCHAVNGLADRAAVEQAMASTLDRVDQLIAGSKGFIGTFSGDSLRLVVLPEYFLTSFPMGESIHEWRTKACIAIDGPEYERMGESARNRGVYLSGTLAERGALTTAVRLCAHLPSVALSGASAMHSTTSTGCTTSRHALSPSMESGCSSK